MTDWRLNRMKKSDIITVFRETEQMLFGFTTSANKAVVEIEELNERIDDYMVQEDMNKKTINELNESNKKLMEKVKFYQVQKENNKKKENKVADYVNNGLIEKIESLDERNQELQGEVVRLEGLSKQRFFENEKLKIASRAGHTECVVAIVCCSSFDMIYYTRRTGKVWMWCWFLDKTGIIID